MAGSPFYAGLFEGFDTRRGAEYQQNLAAEAKTREAEGNVYKYLLQSTDPKIQALAMAGMFESARPGTRAKGLRGFLGEVQGGQIYPQILSAMEEQVPDAGTPPGKPGSAALPSTTPVHGGGMPQAMASPTGQTPEQISGALTTGAPESGFGAPAPMAPPGLAAPMEHPTHRRGTGVPTAEEIAESNARAGIRGRIGEVTSALTGVHAPESDIQRAILGIAGAPPPAETSANGPVMVDPADPATPIPTIRHRDGTLTLVDGTPVPPHYVGYVKATSAGQVTKTIRDPQSPSGYSAVTYDPQGNETRRVPTEFVPPPAYAGTGTFAEPASPTGRTVRPILRGGGVGPDLGPAPAPEGQATPEQAEAEGWIKAIDKQVGEGGVTGIRPRPGTYDNLTKRITQGKYQSYADLQKAAQKSGGIGTTPAGGSMADRVRARIEEGRRQQGAPPPPPPARARGAGPVGAR